MLIAATALPGCDPAWWSMLRPVAEDAGLLPTPWPLPPDQPYVAVAAGLPFAEAIGQLGPGACGLVMVAPSGPAMAAPKGLPCAVHVPDGWAGQWAEALGCQADHASSVPDAAQRSCANRVYSYAHPLDVSSSGEVFSFTGLPGSCGELGETQGEQLAASVSMLVAGRLDRDVSGWSQTGVWLRRAMRPSDFAAAYEVRYRVFVQEQLVPLDEELDWRDSLCQHIVLTVDGQPCGTGRLVPPDEPGGPVHLGRIAIDVAMRGRGYGVRLVQGLEQLALWLAQGDGPTDAVLSAQVQAIGFYERLGYEIYGPVYLDAGIEHRDARKRLA